MLETSDTPAFSCHFPPNSWNITHTGSDLLTKLDHGHVFLVTQYLNNYRNIIKKNAKHIRLTVNSFLFIKIDWKFVLKEYLLMSLFTSFLADIDNSTLKLRISFILTPNDPWKFWSNIILNFDLCKAFVFN